MMVNCRVDNNIIIADISGDIDHSSVGIIKKNINSGMLDFKTNKIILNLSNVTFMDSSGIGMLIGRYKELSLINGEMVLTGLNKYTEKIIKLSGLNKIFRLFKDDDTAIKYLKRGGKNE